MNKTQRTPLGFGVGRQRRACRSRSPAFLQVGAGRHGAELELP